jgi:putative membrane protein
MSVLLLLFWGLVIAAIVALVRSLGGTRQGGPPASSSFADRGRLNAEELLDERFARGEIDQDEYTRRRQLLWAGR